MPQQDMWATFNMGVGMIAAVAVEDADTAVRQLCAAGEDAWRIGTVVAGEGVGL